MNWQRSRAVLLIMSGVSFTCISSANAFEDAECARIDTVQQSYSTEVPTSGDIDAARTRATTEMVKQAIAQVVGFDIRSQREATSKVENDRAEEKYNDAEQALLSGRVRVRVLDEQRTSQATGQNLKLIDEIKVCIPKPNAILKVEKEQRERLAHPPKKISPDDAVWFNPASGAAQVWYSRQDNGSYVFFDNAGFDPESGSSLKEVTQKVLKDYRAFVVKKRKAEIAEAALAKKRAEQAQIAEQQERLKTEHHADLMAHARENCDRLAANPDDQNKPASIAGAAWDELKANSAQAVEVCQAAVEADVSDRRLKYQLARAISVNDPAKSAFMFKELCAARYPAAFDNYGWTFVDKRVGARNLDAALAFFKKGAQLGDSESMVSYGFYVQRGKVPGQGLNEAIALYQKAAALGNQNASKALEPLAAAQAQAQEQQRQAQVQRQQDQQNTQAIMGLFGGIAGGMMRGR